MITRVAVANIWTKPIEGGWVQSALSAEGTMKDWIAGLAFEGRYRLYEENVLQTQVLLGDEVLIIREEGNWLEVCVPSQPSKKEKRGYPGWMHRSQVGQWQEEPAQARFTVTAPKADLRDERGDTQTVVYQTSLPLVREEGERVIVLTPDGPRSIAKEAGQIGKTAKGGGAQLLAHGKQFLGLPYLWGGTSAWGYDCSGFTYTLARAIGYTIPRDADDQAKAGTAVEKEDMQPGDLLFFARDERIHHVGVYAGEGHMLHAPKTGEQIEMIELAGTYYEGALCAVRRIGRTDR